MSENLKYSILKDFYQKVEHDILIGHHFSHLDLFREHLDRVLSFWDKRLDQSESEHHREEDQRLLKLHVPLYITPGQLDRWVFLFFQTLDRYKNELSKDLDQKWRSAVISLRDQFREDDNCLRKK